MCGLIVDEYRFDQGPEHYRFGDRSEERERTGAPLRPARHDRGLSSELGRCVDGYGNPLSASNRRRLGRLRTQHDRGRWRSKGERNRGCAFSEIARLASALELPRAVREEASVLYRRAQAANLILGRSIETMAAGSVYAACRCGGFSRTVEEIAAVARCGPEKVRLGYRLLNAELGLAAAPFGPSELVPRLASACDASSTVEHRALELAAMAEEAGLANGRKPSGVPAACLYVAGREAGRRFTQAGLAEEVGVCEMTVRERYYELRYVIDETSGWIDELRSK